MLALAFVHICDQRKGNLKNIWMYPFIWQLSNKKCKITNVGEDMETGTATMENIITVPPKFKHKNST